MLDKNVDTYSQKEIALDAVTFTGATVAATLASKVHLVNPLSVGTFLLTGANILALAATKKVLDHFQIESKFLRACAIITALALTTIAIPFAVRTLCGASIAILSLEVALTTTLLHLATKVATYGLFKGGLLFKNFFSFSFPSSIQELTSMPQSRLEKVKQHLHDHPEKTKQIPLLFQLTLNRQLQENDLDPLPLQNFSERGENWTQNQLKQLHKEDLHDLPLEKRAAVAELFLYHNFPPQDRPYEKDELPGIDYGTFDKKLSASQLLWVHLITRLNPEAPLYDPIVKQFYRLELTPPRDAWIDLPLPASAGEVQGFKPCQILWYVNFFQAKPKEWENLSLPIQEAFNECFETQRPISYAPPKEVPSLLGRVKKEITWKRAAIAGGALAVTALLATYYFRPDLFPNIGWHKPIDLAKNQLPVSQPASTDPLRVIPSLTESPPIISAKNLSSLEHPVCSLEAPLPEPCFPPSLPSIVSAQNLSVPEQPFYSLENAPSATNFTPLEQPFCFANHSISSTLSNPEIRPEIPKQMHLSSRVADFASGQFKRLMWILAPPVLLAIPLLLSIRSCRRRDPDPREEVPFRLPESPAPEAPLVSDKEELMKSTHALRIKVPGKGEYAFDLRDSIIKDLFEEYLRKAENHTGIRKKSPPLKITYGDFPSTSPIVRLIEGAVNEGFIEAVLKAIETRPLPPARIGEEGGGLPPLPPAEIEEEPIVIDVVAEEKRELKWDAINAYVSEHCADVSFEEANQKIREGITLIQRLLRKEEVEQNDLERKLSAVCWGLMAHSISKGRPFVEGTFDIQDPEHQIFNFFQPVLYGRASSHYRKRTIAFEEGPWRGYAHFGLDLGDLPANKRTVMMGRLKNPNRTYLKMENWGANLNFRTDPRALANCSHLIGHTLEFFASQAKRNLPAIFGEVGGGLHMHKEHMLREDKEMIANLIRRAQEADPSISPPSAAALDVLGFQEAVPFLASLISNPKFSELASEIHAYLEHLHNRCDGLSHRKGDEASVDESILEYHLLTASSASSASKEEDREEIEGFEALESSAEEEIKDWEIAYNRLLSTDVLSNHSVKIFGEFLEKNQKCTFVSDLLIPGIAEKQHYPETYLKTLFNDATKRTRANSPIFIPLILENPSKRIPYIGSYFQDHIVVLTYQNGNWEYYDSRGVKFEIETRNILGLNISPSRLLDSIQEEEKPAVASNLTAHLQVWDWVNCGPFACNYMLQRVNNTPLKEISKKPAKDPTEMRRELAAQLKRRHAPPEVSRASVSEDITARLDFEHPRCHRKRATELLKENARPYIVGEELDSARIFAQINIDLSRPGEGVNQFTLNDIVYDGTPGKNDANALFQELLRTGRAKEQILALMTLLQQGVFASIQMDIMKDLDLLGFDSGLRINGNGEYLAKRSPGAPIRQYNIRTDGRNILLECSISLELSAKDSDKREIAREEPYGILEALVQLDLDAGTASESWQVKEVIE